MSALNLEMDGWAVLDSQYSQLLDNFNTLDQSNAVIYSPFSNGITAHNLAADSLPDYGMIIFFVVAIFVYKSCQELIFYRCQSGFDD